ncbi:MAG: type II toxin-antitoxin system Phd/YefM family antitoxin [Cellulomonadaceae bacterium]|nr:type II toxin-antitoxin system Phd/YefM family antitoxin [Cellulomonadaceae bacterium]
MNTITVAQLRQNPTAMLAEVESGKTYRITRHGREVGRVIPPGHGIELTPAKRPGPMRFSHLPAVRLTTASSLNELLAWNKGEQ